MVRAEDAERSEVVELRLRRRGAVKVCRSMRLLRRDEVVEVVRRIASSCCASRASLSSTSCEAQRKGAMFSLLLSSGRSAVEEMEEHPPILRERLDPSFSSSEESPRSELPRIERRDEVDDRDENRLLPPRTYRGLDGVESVEARVGVEAVEQQDVRLLADC